MADTVLTELKIHEFDTVAQFLQHESEVGENDLALTPFMPANLYLFYHHWADHIVNDPSWLRADTFSWQSGDVYQSAYQHLVADAKTAYAWISGSEIFYTSKETVAVGDEVYVSTTKDSSTIDSVGNNTITFAHPRKDGVYTATRSTANDRLALGLMPFMQSETIGGTTIEFIVADDGHKICAPDQESNLIALYETTGVAWFYILDTENEQFKLPRTKYGFTGLRDSVGGYVPESLPNIRAESSVTNLFKGGGGSFTGAFVMRDGANEGAYGSGSGTYFGVDFDASLSSPTYQDNAPVQERATQMYLYFYVGHFEQDSVEQTAGINTETFNNKADRNLMNTTDNVDIVIESQLPTAENGYTWYRKYKSGWVEQGGHIGPKNVTWTETVVLPVPFENLYYNIALGALEPGADKAYVRYVHVTAYDETTITMTGSYMNTTNNIGCFWSACGMAA